MSSKSTHRHSRSNHPPISYKGHAANMCLDTYNIVIFFEQTSLQSLMLLSALGDMRILSYEWPFSRSKRHSFYIFALLVLVKYDMMTPNVLVLPDTIRYFDRQGAAIGLLSRLQNAHGDVIIGCP